VLDIRDLWPSAAQALGELSDGLAYRAAERLERALYRDATRIVATTEGFKTHIERAAGVPVRVDVVPNGTRVDLFTPQQRDPALRSQLGLKASFVAAYVGLHGIAQDLGTVLAAAERLQGEDVAFLFVGEGPEKAALIDLSARRGLRNVVFAPAVPPEACARYLSAADVALVPLAANAVFTTFIPSKMFDAMACARPVLLSVDGEAREVLERSGAGWFVPPGDPAELAEAIRRAARDSEGTRSRGVRGREFVIAGYSRESQAQKFAEIVEEAAASRGNA
jgi:glycosyltransferase involved in cell wall biosynthesis